MSAGGEFNYEFTAWMPERIVAFVANKGGVYYTALFQDVARSVLALLFVGKNDLIFRTVTLTGLFALNRRAGVTMGIDPATGNWTCSWQIGRNVTSL